MIASAAPRGAVTVEQLGTRGSIQRFEDLKREIDQGADRGARLTQFIGGDDPTLYLGLPELIDHALLRGLTVEVVTSLVYVTPRLWLAFRRPGVSLVTGYTNQYELHAQVPDRPLRDVIQRNLVTARSCRIPLLSDTSQDDQSCQINCSPR
jgi:hypothetical protein